MTAPPPSPTFTPPPPATPTPQPPTPTPTPACALAASGYLAEGWSRDEIGCPTGGAATVWSAYQPFSGGYMFWRSDLDRVFVLYGNSAWEYRYEKWNGGPIPSRGDPPPGLIAPERGFGYVWGTVDSVANGLSWATDIEKGFCADFQPFDNGFIMRANRIGPCQGDLYNWATDPTFPDLFLVARDDNAAWRWQY
jgi:hypothetical protein